jgi:hypothetical protein
MTIALSICEKHATAVHKCEHRAAYNFATAVTLCTRLLDRSTCILASFRAHLLSSTLSNQSPWGLRARVRRAHLRPRLLRRHPPPPLHAPLPPDRPPPRRLLDIQQTRGYHQSARCHSACWLTQQAPPRAVTQSASRLACRPREASLAQ